MIETHDTKTAISAAQKALAREDISWIRKSYLIERAYYLGLYFGLEAIASKEDIKQLLITLFFDTMRGREGDDSFAGTRIGRTFAVLNRHVDEGTEIPDQVFEDSLQNLSELVEERKRFLHHHLNAIDESLTEFSSQIEQDPLRDRERRHRFMESMERNLRVIALLELDHNWAKNIGD